MLESQVAFSIRYNFSVTSMYAMLNLSYAPQVLCDLSIFWQGKHQLPEPCSPQRTQLCLPVALMVHTSGCICSLSGSLYSADCTPQCSAVHAVWLCELRSQPSDLFQSRWKVICFFKERFIGLHCITWWSLVKYNRNTTSTNLNLKGLLL